MFKLWFDAPCLKCKINMHLYSGEGSGWKDVISYVKQKSGGRNMKMI